MDIDNDKNVHALPPSLPPLLTYFSLFFRFARRHPLHWIFTKVLILLVLLYITTVTVRSRCGSKLGRIQLGNILSWTITPYVPLLSTYSGPIYRTQNPFWDFECDATVTTSLAAWKHGKKAGSTNSQALVGRKHFRPHFIQLSLIIKMLAWPVEKWSRECYADVADSPVKDHLE